MVKKKRKVGGAEWDCRDINVPHSNSFTHKAGLEDGLPNYEAQLNDNISITICQKCHPRIPGHIINIEPDDLSDYFQYNLVSDLFSALPDGFTGSGLSKEYRERVFRYSMNDRFNPYPNHAGKTLRISLGYQWDRDEWKPDDEVIESMYNKFTNNCSERY